MNQEEDKSSLFDKVFGGVLIAGSALYLGKNTNLLKNTAKAFNATTKAFDGMSDDLAKLSFREKTWDNISSSFKKNISNTDSVFKNSLSEGITLSSNEGLLGAVKDFTSFQKHNTSLLGEVKDNYQVNEVLSSLKKTFKDKDDTFIEQLQVFTQHVFDNKNTFFMNNLEGSTVSVNSEFEEALTGGIFTKHKDTIEDVFTKALLDSQESLTDITEEYHINLKPKLEKEYKEAILSKFKKKDEFFENTVSKALEVGEFLERYEAGGIKNTKDLDPVVESLKTLVEEDDSFTKLVLDSASIRVDKATDEVFSMSPLKKARDAIKDDFADTLFGKLFGVRSQILNDQAPDFYYFGKNTYDKVLGSIEGSENGLLKNNYFKVGNKVFQYKDSSLLHVKEADNIELIGARHGNQANLLNTIFGNTDYNIVDSDISKNFDLGTKGTNKFREIQGAMNKFSKDSGWGPRVSERLFGDYYDILDAFTPKKNKQFSDDMKKVNKMFNDQTYSPTKRTISQLKEIVDKRNHSLLDAVDSDDIAATILNSDFDLSTLKNKDLKSLLNKYKNNSRIAKQSVHIGDFKTTGKGKNILKYDDLLKREIVKESLMYNAKTNPNSLAVVKSKINRLDASKVEKKNINDLYNWSILQDYGDLYNSSAYKEKNFKDSYKSYVDFIDLMQGKQDNTQRAGFVIDFKKEVTKFVRDGSSLTEAGDISNNKKLRAFKTGSYMAINKKTSVLDILKDINNDIKTTENIKKYGKQFIAGRNDVQNVTKATMLPFHMINRLISPLEELGLGFSKDSTSSVGSLIKNAGLKRILPIIGGAYALSYLNYESEKLTGTSFTEAANNAASQMMLGVKTVMDATGYDAKAKAASRYNPIAEYWGGDYKDREEYLDYLEYGYDPVRKGRFWSFGSTSEFRGGKVSYWKPNSLRSAHSNYYDNSVYGSSDEKWKHSWMPSLRYPLSPLVAALNPYWLEKKHMEDRPYPLSAPLFEEGTPWGAILNPTVGAVLKPQIEMHKDVLQGTSTDVRTIIAARNQRVKEASNERSMGRIDGSGLSNVAFTPYSMPGSDEAIFSMNINNGSVSGGGFAGQQYAETLGDFNNVQIEGQPMMYPDDVQVVNSSGGKIVGSQSVKSKAKTSSLVTDFNALVSGTLIKYSKSSSTSDSKALISNLNKSIFTSSEMKKQGLTNQIGNVHRTPISRYAEEVKNNYIDNMIEDRSKNDYVKDMIYSGKQLSGIYGFLFDQVTTSKKTYEMENAGQIGSFARTFWDSSVGGIGGNFMEIARRFFPHEDHDVTMVNNIRNTMPDWLPERFRLGDPYTKVPIGEARLPGTGYESLNKLHSDQYGEYGAFDRYKILGDIAPLSEEYKTWRKIARQNIKHPFLLREMDNIDKRVKEQTKEHDFYNYKFLGKRLSTHKSYVDAVNKDGTFTVVGSEEIYKLAGIDIGVDQETGLSNVSKVFKPGMEVSLKYEDNEYRNRNSAGQISTLAFVNGQSVTRELYNQKLATENYNKETLADNLFALNNSEIGKGHIFEAIAHAPIPYIHNKYLRIDSPLESYNKEQVYGTSYSTWSHPIKGYIKPTFQEAWSRGPVAQTLGLSTLALSLYATNNINSNIGKGLAHTAFALTNPGGFAGAVIGAIPRMTIGSKQSKFNSRNLSVVGAAVGFGGYAVTHLENPLLSMGNFAAIGFALNEQFKFGNMNGGKLGNGTAALIGAGIGLGLSALKNPEFSLDKLNEKWIPKDTEKKWEIEEYYDRLEYLKYMNLYTKASRKARRKEGVDVKRIISNYEKNREDNIDTIKKLEAQKADAQKIINEQVRNDLIANIDNQIKELETPEQYFTMGEYAKSALAYKKAAESTIYGLTQFSSNSDILRALPKYNRDFFLEFAGEKDPRERKKILKTISPYQAKALKVLWGEDPKGYDIEDNNSYFQDHNLPGMVWRGWDTRVDLDKIKIKTIENEGMLLSDFGIYDSQKDDPTYMTAPEIESMFSDNSKEKTQLEIVSLLNGLGFTNIDVSVDASQQSGLQVVTNIKREISYNISSALNSIF